MHINFVVRCRYDKLFIYFPSSKVSGRCRKGFCVAGGEGGTGGRGNDDFGNFNMVNSGLLVVHTQNTHQLCESFVRWRAWVWPGLACAWISVRTNVKNVCVFGNLKIPVCIYISTAKSQHWIHTLGSVLHKTSSFIFCQTLYM